jgi:phage-related protein
MIKIIYFFLLIFIIFYCLYHTTKIIEGKFSIKPIRIAPIRIDPPPKIKIGASITSVYNKAKDQGTQVVNTVSSGAQQTVNTVSSGAQNVVSQVKDGIHQAQDIVVNGVTMAAQMVDAGFKSFEDEVNQIGNVFNGVGGSIENVGIILKKFSQIPTYVKEIGTQIDKL